MSLKGIATKSSHYLRFVLTSLVLFQFSLGGPLVSTAQAQENTRDNQTRTPIKHVIVIIGENRSFDHVFATYVPKRGQKVWNLLSEGIVNADGTPGPNFSKVEQKAAFDQAPDAFLLNPDKVSFSNSTLPAPLVGGPKDSYITGDSLMLAQQSENGLPSSYYQDLISGGTGQTSKTPDARITDVNSLPAGPFQLTNGNLFTYNSYVATIGLRLGARHSGETFRMRFQVVSLGRSYSGRRHEWFAAAVKLQHGIFGHRDDNGRRVDGYGFLQRSERRCSLLQTARR